MAKVYDPNVVHVVNCAEVEVDRNWNSRKGVESASETPEGSKGFAGLVVSLATEGQKQPVVIRPNPRYKAGDKGAKPLSLVSGFQRWEAITRIAAGEEDAILLDTKTGAGMTAHAVNAAHTKEPTVRAFILAMSDWEARKENLGENMQRNALSVPDCAFGVADLRRLNPDLKDQAVANLLGKAQGYVSQLKRITETVKGKLHAGALYETSKPVAILDAWRTAKTKISANAMEEVGKVDVDKQADLYLLKAGYKVAAGGVGDKPKAGAHGWAHNASLDAKEFGTLLGELALIGAITLDANFFEFETVCKLISPVRKESKKPVSEEQMSEICAVCEDAYNTARAGKFPADVGVETVSPVKNGNGKKAKAETATA